MNTSLQYPTLSAPRRLLSEELARRCSKNPRYSMRAFAQAIGISHTVLSLVMSGKRPLSRKAAAKVADALSLDPTARAAISERTVPVIPVNNDQYDTLSEDAFAVISEWYHYAILSLLEIPGSRLEGRWIAARLGIGQAEAKLAIERLKRLDLVSKDASGCWRQAGKSLRVDNVAGVSAARKFHRQLLELALHSLENDSPDRRDVGSMTFALDPKHLPYARKRLRAFRRELVSELEGFGKPEAVYNLTMQLFPVTRPTNRSSALSSKESSLS
jgi:transcriptional regulator with XRE-family HTH domain